MSKEIGLKRIREVVPLEGFQLRLTLTDGTVIERDVFNLLRGPVFDPVRKDTTFFRQVRVEQGALVWPNGADLCPDVLVWGGPPPAGDEGRQPEGSISHDATKRLVDRASVEKEVAPAPRSSRAKGAALEDEVESFLKRHAITYQRPRWFTTPFGRWEVDLFVPGQPPTVIECKNPTREALSPAGSVQRKVQEAFFKLYMLQHYCAELPRNTRYFLVLGDLSLVVKSQQFGQRNYEDFLLRALSNLEVVPRSQLSRLLVLKPALQ